jgi:TolB-like protein/tetratricopeptide (TPR) repeat protein
MKDGQSVGRRFGRTSFGAAVLVLAALPTYRPADAWAQCPDGTPPPCTRPAAAAPAAGANSVAVMLFTNVTGDSAYAYLSDGLSSEIATSLARVPRLEVRSPGAVRSAQRGDADPRSVGRRLNVRYVVEGDYQRGGERIRVSVRLVAVPNGTQRWAESYTRPAADLLVVQEEIARNVATAIAGQLLPQERSVLAVQPTRNADAYDRFLRGNFHLARRTPGAVARAIDEYTAAVTLDPSFAQASARIALSYALFLDWGWDFPGVPADSQLARGIRAADRALGLDGSSSDGWMARGYLASFLNPRTLEGVLQALERSTTLDSRNAEAWHQYASWLAVSGRLEEGVAAAQRSLVIEPGRPVSYLQMGQVLEIMRRDAEAGRAYDSALAADPEFYAAYFQRTWIRLRAGDVGGARADAEAALRYSPPGEEYYGLAALTAVAAHTGDSATARSLMARATAPLANRSLGPVLAATVVYGLVSAGQLDEAIAFIERADPLGALLWINLLFPAIDPLRADPRFQRIMADIRPPGARQ